MAMLDRYKKSGGFNQLLLLLETCGPAKQQKLMELIAAENQVWFEALKTKMLSIEKILSWKDQVVIEIFAQQNDLTLGVFFHGQNAEMKERIMKMMPNSRKIRIEDEFKTKNPTPPEIATINFKIIEFTRSLISKREINIAEIDPKLDIPDGFEEKLNALAKGQTDTKSAPAPGTPEPMLVMGSMSNSDRMAQQEKIERSMPLSGDVMDLQRKVMDLQKENAHLKQELKVAQSKLEQIKRIA